MIRVKFYVKDGRYIGFAAAGHADYADSGKDIICAAVSALVINTVNSIENLTEARSLTKGDCRGHIYLRVFDQDESTELLMKSLRQGLIDIYKEYGDEYIRIFFKEE